MAEVRIGHLVKLPIEAVDEAVDAEPRVPCSCEEIQELLKDLYLAVDNENYIPQTPTLENPSLSDDYIFNTSDENLVLKDLQMENFVAKIKDLSKGATRRKAKG